MSCLLFPKPFLRNLFLSRAGSLEFLCLCMPSQGLQNHNLLRKHICQPGNTTLKFNATESNPQTATVTFGIISGRKVAYYICLCATCQELSELVDREYDVEASCPGCWSACLIVQTSVFEGCPSAKVQTSHFLCIQRP